jgi:L-lactate dehydrogenase complex protein LldG
MSRNRFDQHDVLKRVRRALGRDRTPAEVPAPPPIPEHVVRLVHTDLGLVELFCARAKANQMQVTACPPEDIASAVVERLRALGVTRLLASNAPVFERLGIWTALKDAGVEVSRWGEGSLDAAYDTPAGLTDVFAGVAETGSLVIRPDASHGRAPSLVPEIHLAIVEPRNLVPDLVDLFDKVARDNSASGLIIISGPSKTADIEMNLVVGVHGPGRVELFVIR